MNKLYRSESDKVIGGVAGGLANYLGIDSVIIRIVFILLTLAQASGVLIYVILWIIMPTESSIETETAEIVKEGVDEIKKKTKEVVKDVKKNVKSDSKKK